MLLTVPHGGRFGNVLRDVGPVFAAVARDLDQAIVGAGPDQSFFFWRLGDCKDDGRILDADVVAGQAAGESLLALVVRSQIGTDQLPALPASVV